jgi:putative ABC transport system permease protein
MSTLHHDVVVALRRLRRAPIFTTGALLVLALALGVNTAIFTLVQGVILRPLPFRDPERLAAVSTFRPDTDRGAWSLPNLLDYRAQSRSFEGIGAAFQWSANITGGDEAERLQGMRVTANYFDLLGAEAHIGRTLTAADERVAVALLSDGLWRRRFGGDPAVLGHAMILNGDAFTVVGVLRPDFTPQIRDAEVIVPFETASDPRRDNRALGFLRPIARLKPGMTMGQASEELTAITARLRKMYPATNGSDLSATAVPLAADLIGPTGDLLRRLSGAVVLLLLVACANLACLQLVQASGRTRELATRVALGATRTRIVRQLIVESLLLAAAGGLAGLLVARAGVAALLAISPATLPRANEVALDVYTVLFNAALALGAGVVFGLAPAVHLSRAALAPGIGSGRRTAGSDGRRLRSVLIAVEVAVSMVLIVAAGLLARSFVSILRVDPGFTSAHVLSVRLSLPRTRYAHTSDIDRFYQDLVGRLHAIPGAREVAAANVVPLNGYYATADFEVEGDSLEPGQLPESHYRMVSSGYFRTLGVPLVRGRAFDDTDRANSTPVVIVNRTLARKHFGQDNPIGHRLIVHDAGTKTRVVEIVGVCGDIRHRGLDLDPPMEMFVPIAQVPDATSIWLANNMYWLVATDGPPLNVANAVRRAVAAVDPQVPASFVRSMDQWLESSVAARRFTLRLIVFFAIAALTLAAIGVYSVAASVVVMRTREIGIRAALGASPQGLTRWLVINGLFPVAAGMAAGLVMSVLASPLLSGMLYGIRPADPATLVAVSALFGATGLAAAYVPARRARRVDPIVALSVE